MRSPTAPVLIVEDDPDDVRVTSAALRANGRHPVVARRGAEALEVARTQEFGVIVIDYRLPDISGVEVCRRMRQMALTAPILLTSSVESDEVIARAREAGASDFLVKGLRYAEHLGREIERLAGSLSMPSSAENAASASPSA